MRQIDLCDNRNGEMAQTNDSEMRDHDSSNPQFDAFSQARELSPSSQTTPDQGQEPDQLEGIDSTMIDAEEPNQLYYEIEFPAPVEDPNAYGPGGLHPVQLGDTLGDDNQFRVVHKLGDGGFGTVWLCRDTISSKWRAVKIIAAGASDPENEGSCPDLAIMERFADLTPKELAEQHIGIPIEYFWLDGPNGRHLCTVMPLLGPRLADIYQWYGTCPMLLKHLCFQVTKGLSFLHSHGYCHGDLRPENILFQLADGIDELSEDELLQLLGRPETVKVVTFGGDSVGPGVPEYLVSKTAITFASGMCSTNVAITDLGLSYPIDGPPNAGIPLPYAAPEDIFGCGTLGPAADVWALGCTIMQIATNLLPWRNDLEVHGMVQKMEETMGPLPHPFRDAWEREFQYAYENDREDESVFVSISQERLEQTRKRRIESGDLPDYLLGELVNACWRLSVSYDQAAEIATQDYARTGVLPGFTKLDRIAAYDDRVEHRRDEADMKLLHDLLMRIFRWHPESRASVDEVLDHPWLEAWFNCKENPSTEASPPASEDSFKTWFITCLMAIFGATFRTAKGLIIGEGENQQPRA
ncbi:kinase-like domain-containing protein [Cercophora newfieldiana]|uniref:EKC/KEOPS complex subunit BUD32 n=1 Tax=Cercophora newfieldiana TaxID=92897 RepID=A0AA40CRV4_9PEZI|nr:kinase-like domain-containing protein [Cercophora newfieldiana]